ncbi:MAG: hypothetical protein O2779_01845 [Nanoarchaeota archaeon]|nr:hypothetical protein [Nanoarchaeota archaeon]
MNETVRKDILLVLTKSIAIMKKTSNSAMEMRNLSNSIIHSATIFQDKDSTDTAILIYSISKIMERSGKSTNSTVLQNELEKAKKVLERKDERQYQADIQKIFKIITKLDNKLTTYVDHLLTHASAKKACNLCEHGVSVGRAAEISGTSKWELMSQMGQSYSPTDNTSRTRQRLQVARRLFK